MVGGPPPGGSDSALRALQSASGEVETLRHGGLDPQTERGVLLRVANAVDRSLRRFLRDDEAADLGIRLKALAPDELRTDAVLAELRRNERLPMEVAAAVHELFEIRRRLEGGDVPQPGWDTRAVRVTELLRSQIERGGTPVSAAVSEVSPVPPSEEIDEDFDSVGGRRSRRRTGTPVPVMAIGALLLLIVVVVAGIWMVRGRGPSEMEQGIALFRSGAYAEAAQHFWRYAEANPRDPTPHLYLARIHRRMDRPELAAEAIREAQERAPEDPAVHRELGFLLLDTGQPDVAVSRFRHAIELDESSSEGWIGLVRALREAGQTLEAERVISQAPAEVQALLARPAPF